MNDDVMIAVDPHKASNTAAVLDPVSKTVIDSARFANTADGYAQLTTFAGRWAQRRWAVEGCHGAGRSLAQRLAADGEMVLDVPAKLAARVRVYSRGHGRKTGKHDAVSIGLAALEGTGILPVACDDVTVSLRLLRPARGAHRAAHPGGVPAAPAAGRADARRDAPRADREQGPGAARQDPPRGRRRGGPAAHRPGPPRRHPRSRCEAQVHRGPDRRAGHRVRDHADEPVRRRPGDRRADSGRGRRHHPVRRQGQVRQLQRHRPDRRVLRRPGPPPAVPRREPADQPRAAHDGGHPDPLPGHRRAPLLRAQAHRGQNPEGGAALPQAAAIRSGLAADRPRPAGQNRNVRITYDPATDAVYIYLTGQRLTRGRTSIPATPPEGVPAFVALDWKDDRLVGIEILDASSRLHPDLLQEAEILS